MLPVGISLGAFLSMCSVVLGVFALLGGVNQSSPWTRINAAELMFTSSFPYYFIADKIAVNAWGYCIQKGDTLIACETPKKPLTSQSGIFAQAAINYFLSTMPNATTAERNYIVTQATLTSAETTAQIQSYMSVWTQLEPILRGVLIAFCAITFCAALLSLLSPWLGPKSVLGSLGLSVVALLVTVGTISAAAVGSKKLTDTFKGNGLNVNVSLKVSFWLVVAGLATSLLAALLFWQGYYMFSRRLRPKQKKMSSDFKEKTNYFDEGKLNSYPEIRYPPSQPTLRQFEQPGPNYGRSQYDVY